ncbi:MAG: type I-E CRISPR-associated protein Cas6/Cse3/CasE [Agitococcus sp.]|jgi:CRISPR system Cascade subunit CasE|nr:type I-E CRISPR-associated protein Cas6/Cse3/CasE [Agitococcus sp.]MBP8110765.1 type I-E CRISPR-associated protein Cas6/Cse3/CasE [Agitococcus sp.]
MYLSKVFMSWEHCRNPYQWHRALWRLFPQQPHESRSSPLENRQGFLFCLDKMQTGEGAVVLVQSPFQPINAEEGVKLLTPSKLFTPQLTIDELLYFRLTANPVKTIRDSEYPEKKKRVPLIDEQQQIEWLKRQFSSSADILQVAITPNKPLFFQKKGGQSGKIATVTFEGVLRVVNMEQFTSIHRNGLGHAKAFGCGLLLIKRV